MDWKDLAGDRKTRFRLRPLTLAFVDPAIEEHYLVEYAAQVQNRWMGWIVGSTVVFVAAALAATALLPGGHPLITAAWATAIVGSVLNGGFFAMMRMRTFHRHVFDFVLVVASLLSVTYAVILGSVPRHVATHYAMALFIAHIANTSAGIGLRFVHSVGTGLVAVTAFAWIACQGVDLPAFERVVQVSAVFGGMAIAQVGARRAEQRARWEFVQSVLLQEERERSERLLRNVLPTAIADRLKDQEGSLADAFAEVTVVFADIVGFTPLSARLSPHHLVDLLDEIFTRFDELADLHGLEKIKTIGDAYMAAAGLPVARPDHAEAAARLALAMRGALAEIAARRNLDLALRIGLCSGPVIAGVIGKRKFIYDLWGDTVNTASRMESHGAAGRIQITEGTYERLRGRFVVEARGMIEVKGKGALATWFLEGEVGAGEADVRL